MRATITNMGTVPVPLTSTEGNGLVVSLDPGVAYMLNDDAITVVTVGDNSSVLEDIKEGLETLYELAKKLITFWRAHPAPREGDDNHPMVNIRVVAEEGNAIRVTGDDKNLDQEVVPGSTVDVTMKDYVELRQLGVGGAATQPEAP